LQAKNEVIAPVDSVHDGRLFSWLQAAKMAKTYNSGYSLVVTHLTTNPPVRCLNRAERTGSLVFNVLWSYVEKLIERGLDICGNLQLLIAIKTKFYQSKPSFTFKACGPLSTN
jgi:hypothetical protein